VTSSLATCFREASILQRLRHPYIIEITAIFEDPDKQPPCFYIEMPFYEHGQLDAWIRKEDPDSLSIRRVLQQVCLAIAHLHQSGVVHNDIKPANVLIAADGSARLADFDVSLDAAARTSLVRTSATGTRGGTLGYIAPEFLTSGSTKAADMYAFGATIAAVLPTVAGTERDANRDDLVKMLMDPNPELRPGALAALQHAFFQPLIAWQKKIATGSCDACLESNMSFNDGARCPVGVHLLCKDCFPAQVRSQSGDDERQRFEENGCQVVCQFCPRDGSIAFSDAMVAQHVPDHIFALLLRSRSLVAERRICEQQETQFQQRLAVLRNEFSSAMDQDVQKHRLHIAEEILTLHCPRCKQAFFEFDGCFALRCGRCSCNFCAWCLADCGNDAHVHVLACPAARNRRDYYGTWDQFTAAQRQRRCAAIEAYLRPLAGPLRSRVIEACAADFRDLGLEIA